MNMGSDPSRHNAARDVKPEKQSMCRTAGTENQQNASISGGSLKDLSEIAHVVRHECLHGQNKGANPQTEALQSRRKKLENVIQRLASGYYDQPEIRQKIADKFADDIQ